MEYVDIYDSKRNIVRSGERTELRANDEYLLAVHNWIVDADGKLLIQKRAACKKYDPNKWGVTGGFARKGESSADACIRETTEEVGIALNPCQMRCVISYSLDNIHYDVWLSQIDTINEPLVLQESEVSETAWISFRDLENIDFVKGVGMLFNQPILCQKYHYLPLMKNF